VTGPGGEQMLLQLAYFDRGRAPVVMDLGPVLDLEDAVGGKAARWPAGSNRGTTQTWPRRWDATARRS
jgi:hypothetical protein